jgi:hypothetical protein
MPIAGGWAIEITKLFCGHLNRHDFDLSKCIYKGLIFALQKLTGTVGLEPTVGSLEG